MLVHQSGFRRFPLFQATEEGDNNGGAGDDAAAKAKADADKAKADQGKDDGTKAALEALQKSNKEMEAKLAAYQKKEQEEADKQKTAEQKLAEKDAELAKVRREAMVIKLATQKGLDTDLIDRVRGEDETAIGADIDLLLEKFKKPEPGAGAKGGVTPSGKTGTPAEEEKPTGQKAVVADYMAARAAQLGK